jgi:(p)ppGpp synthase/HD superfamily hydrolase
MKFDDVLLNTAIVIATEAHAGQKDLAGKPYILHPLRVMLGCKDQADQIVAVLHDVVEDCPGFTVEGFRGTFGDEIADAIDAITKRKGEEYGDYLIRVAANPIAKRVKIQDLKDNSDLGRLPEPTEKDLRRCSKYAAAMSFLMAAT